MAVTSQLSSTVNVIPIIAFSNLFTESMWLFTNLYLPLQWHVTILLHTIEVHLDVAV
jgi:hypothetical protein